MGAQLGQDAKLYYKIGGQAAGGSYIELPNVMNLSRSTDIAEADASTRGNAGFKATVATQIDLSLDFDMVYDEADAGFAALEAAAFAKTIVAFKALSNATGNGIVGDFMFTKFSKSEDLNDVQKVSCTVRLTYSATPPSLVT